MPLFDSILHAFGAAGTGGFGIKADSLAGYSPYLQSVITIFMFLFGINFNLYYLILLGRLRSVLKSGELWFYISIVFVAIISVTINIIPLYATLSEAIRYSSFQVVSIVTTSGFATTDFNLWPGFSKMILVVLMFIGGCAGSTAGGIKVSRVLLTIKMIRRDLRRMLHPRSVGVVKMEGKKVDDATLSGVNGYLLTYFLLFFVLLLLLSLEPFSFETIFTAAAACFNNVGPGLGAVGPMANYTGFSDPATLLLSFAMLFGRLEIFPLLLALSPSTWLKK